MTHGSTHSGKTLISLRGVGVRYYRKKSTFRRKPFWALQDVSLDLHEGESLGVVGRNGAGKSTLLRLLAGIIQPNKGQLDIRGVQAALLSLDIGFAPYLTGRENAYLCGMLLGLRKHVIAERMDEIIDYSELGDFFDQPISTYSSGMRARLGFSVGFLVDPDVLLIDEIYGVGDAAFREKSSRSMQEKIRSNKTIVIVSHSPEALRELCDRAVWIDEGITKAEGTVNDVLAAYYDTVFSAHSQFETPE